MEFDQVGVSTPWDIVPLKRVNHLHELLILKKRLVRRAVLLLNVLLEVFLKVEVHRGLVFGLASLCLFELLDHLLLPCIHFIN